MGKVKKTLVQHNHQIGYWSSGNPGIGSFESLTTFGLQLLKHVLAPEGLPHDAGFVVEVLHAKGDGDISRGYVFSYSSLASSPGSPPRSKVITRNCMCARRGALEPWDEANNS